MYKIIRREELNPTVTLVEIECPEIAAKAEPGQFVIVRSDEDARTLRGGAGAAHTPFGALEYFPVEKIAREISLPSAFRWCLPLLRRAAGAARN